MSTPETIRILAEWEDANGSLAGAMYDEWIKLYKPITNAAVAESPRMARTAVDSLLSSHRRIADALSELVRIRDWAALAGGCDGPLPQDVIQKFAEQQIPAIDAARAALAAIPEELKS